MRAVGREVRVVEEVALAVVEPQAAAAEVVPADPEDDAVVHRERAACRAGANMSMPWWKPVEARGAPKSSEKLAPPSTGNAYSPDEQAARARPRRSAASCVKPPGGGDCVPDVSRRGGRARTRAARPAPPGCVASVGCGAAARRSRRARAVAVGRRRRLAGGRHRGAGVRVADDELGAGRQAAVGRRAAAGAARRRSVRWPRSSRSASTRSPTVRSPTPAITIDAVGRRRRPAGPATTRPAHDACRARLAAPAVVRLGDGLDRDLAAPSRGRRAARRRRRARSRERRRSPSVGPGVDGRGRLADDGHARVAGEGERARAGGLPGARLERRDAHGALPGDRDLQRQRGGTGGRLRRRRVGRGRGRRPRDSREAERAWRARAGGVATSL